MNDGQYPIPQALVQELLIPVLQQRGKRYRKFQQILARSAVKGEVVVSITSSGVETSNTASDGDFVVMNLTGARETYIVPEHKFFARYSLVTEEEDGWKRYHPRGEVIALNIEVEILNLLERTSPFEIQAAWGESQLAELSDFLVTPPDCSEIYRIGRREFFETYQLIIDK